MIAARVSKDGKRLLCGACRQDMGLILTGRNSSGMIREVWLPQGWTVAYGTQDLVWRFSTRGRRKLAQGEPLRERRPLVDRYKGEIDGWRPWLPATIICPMPGCAWSQLMDAAALGLTPFLLPSRRLPNVDGTESKWVPGERRVLSERDAKQFDSLIMRLNSGPA